MKNDGNNCIYRPLVIELPMTVEKNIGVQIFMNNKKTIKKIFAVFLLPALLLSGCGKQSSNKTLIPGSSILPAPTKAVTEMETKKANQIDLTGVLTYVNTDDLIMHLDRKSVV